MIRDKDLFYCDMVKPALFKVIFKTLSYYGFGWEQK